MSIGHKPYSRVCIVVVGDGENMSWVGTWKEARSLLMRAFYGTEGRMLASGTDDANEE